MSKLNRLILKKDKVVATLEEIAEEIAEESGLFCKINGQSCSTFFILQLPRGLES